MIQIQSRGTYYKLANLCCFFLQQLVDPFLYKTEQDAAKINWFKSTGNGFVPSAFSCATRKRREEKIAPCIIRWQRLGFWSIAPNPILGNLLFFFNYLPSGDFFFSPSLPSFPLLFLSGLCYQCRKTNATRTRFEKVRNKLGIQEQEEKKHNRKRRKTVSTRRQRAIFLSTTVR